MVDAHWRNSSVTACTVQDVANTHTAADALPPGGGCSLSHALLPLTVRDRLEGRPAAALSPPLPLLPAQQPPGAGGPSRCRRRGEGGPPSTAPPPGSATAAASGGAAATPLLLQPPPHATMLPANTGCGAAPAPWRSGGCHHRCRSGGCSPRSPGPACRSCCCCCCCCCLLDPRVAALLLLLPLLLDCPWSSLNWSSATWRSHRASACDRVGRGAGRASGQAGGRAARSSGGAGGRRAGVSRPSPWATDATGPAALPEPPGRPQNRVVAGFH
jgi:hypothetical protein